MDGTFHGNGNQDEIIIPSGNGYVVIPAHNLREEKRSEFFKPSDNLRWISYRLGNVLQFLLMALGMIGMLGYVGYAIGGIVGLIVVSLVGMVGFMITSNFKIEQILRRKNLRSIHPVEGRTLYSMVEKLAAAAGLTSLPRLFLDRKPEINAYTVEDRDKAAIVLSNGLLENLDKREIYGVLAHEIAHLKNNDIRIMLATDHIRRITGYMAFLGQVLFIVSLPLLLINQVIVPWSLILLLMAAPFASTFFQIALSRNREFRADLDAVALSNDPLGLASALNKISVQTGIWKRLYAPYIREVPELLRTHPNTRQRIQRLERIQHEKDRELVWST
ncbi:MAG: M48 family metalloprotease [Proteobacteria bacterium]|nr:M48 family metalloprotease [Pseudomonadota bacterium]